MALDTVNRLERDRRWKNIRDKLAQSDLDGILIVSDGQLERRGSVRYVSHTDPGAYTTLMWHYVVFPREGEPKAINIKGGWIEDARSLSFRGGWVPESEPYAPIMADMIRELHIDKGKIGIEGDSMPLPVYQRLVRELPDATFESSDTVRVLMRIKSPAEIKLVEKGVEMMDRAYEACLKFARPGKTWNDVTSEVCRVLYHFGAEDIGGYPLSRSTNIIKPGDTYNLYPEAQAAGGYWIQLGRLISFGEPQKELRSAWELNIRAQELGAEKLRPGNTGADVMKAINDALKGSKYTGAPRSSGHAIGLDILEKPYLSLDEDTVFEPGMVVSIHPVFSPPVAAFEANADMFVVTEDRPRKLSPISPEIVVIS